MNAFTYFNPVKVIYSEGALAQVGEHAAAYGKKALIVSYDNVSFMEDKLEILRTSLKEAGVEYTEFFKVVANPKIQTAREGAQLCKENGIDLVIGFGGGSAMDSAKAIAAYALYENGDILNMFMFSHSDVTCVPPEKALPTIMIPTLPATGSEMNQCGVLTNEETCQKSYVWADCLFPKVAVLDPTLITGLPAYQTACGGVDIIAHAAEAYLNGDSSVLALQDGLELGVMRAVKNILPHVLDNPTDLDARGTMLWAADLALCGIVNAGTMVFTPMHQMGHVLSAQYNATHGATLACMMPAWMRFFAKREDNARYKLFAKEMFGCESIEEAADIFENWMKNMGIQTRISQFGAKEEDIAKLASEVKAVSFGPDGKLGSNPKLSEEDIAQIYRIAL